ncbi:MAG: hypothetical protein UZ07_CHB004001435 [Chlorobi bacterium OLB7]|nr:MAG: hypothetical protein UZ07_CHB004001435 [Chlorobi bacterium OLB7]
MNNQLTTAMKRSRIAYAATLAAALFAAQQGMAQIPGQMTYQGLLTNSNGTPFPDGSVTMTFNIYEGATAIWSETQSVQISKGLFNVTLGQSTSLSSLKFDKPYQLGVTIGGSELTRTPLVSAPYALSAASALTVPNGAITTDKLANGAVTLDKLSPTLLQNLGSAVLGQIPDGSISPSKIGTEGSSNGQVLVNNGGTPEWQTLNSTGGGGYHRSERWRWAWRRRNQRRCDAVHPPERNPDGDDPEQCHHPRKIGEQRRVGRKLRRQHKGGEDHR